MSRLLCCLRARTSGGQADMGAALSHVQEGEACEGGGPVAPPTMADVIRERKKKAGGAGLGTLRRRLAAAARRPRDARQDRGCEHARFIRAVVGSWRLAEVVLLGEELEAGAALRDLATQAELAREPAAALYADLARACRDRWWCDVELVGGNGGGGSGGSWSLRAHRAVLAARCTYFRDLLQRYPSGSCRVPLEGACAALSREEVEASVFALYAGSSAAACARRARGRARAACRAICDLCAKWERGGSAEGDLDIINMDNTGTWRSSGGECACAARVDGAAVRRLGALLGFSPDALHRDMRYLLDSGEYADARLVFRLEGGCGAQYGFRTALELPCHRVVLAARSRFFRSVMSRRTSSAGGNSSGAVCVDEKVLPRRFARALLHAAYTDQVDLSLIGRGSSSPSSTNSTGSSNTGWGGVSRSGGGAGSPRAGGGSALEDAFQLYEIARFLEMPIVVQGCEDAIVEALSAETLPHVLRWASAPHASQWVHRQAMRYLRDEFPSIMSHAASARLPRGALAEALASPFLQASEAQALRALVRWGERAAALEQPIEHREPNVVWHTAHSVSLRGARRREVSDAALREVLSALAPLVRTELLPPDHELLQQLVRRGVLPAPPAPPEAGSTADAWLGRGSYRAPRCLLPYLDEIKALLEDQAVPEAEVARLRRARYLHRIPDTLYMVAAARNGSTAESSASSNTESACVSPRVLAALRERARELRAAPPAARALALHSTDWLTVYRQIALRAVREMSLPDACAELLLSEADSTDGDRGSEWRSPSASPSPRADRRPGQWADADLTSDCCRVGVGAARCSSAGSLRSATSLHIPLESGPPRVGACRREPRAADGTHRQVWDECGGEAPRASRSGAPCGPGATPGGALSAAVPDVAMAPNANTHLLTARDYFRPHAALRPEYAAGGVLQLDLGDGATHTPRPGSRAQRAALGSRQTRDTAHAHPHGHAHAHAQVSAVQVQAQAAAALSCARARFDDDELRAALDLSVMRAAYSVFHNAGSPQPPGNPGARCRPPSGSHAGNTSTLPPCYRAPVHNTSASNTGSNTPGGARARSSPGALEPAAHVSRHNAVHTPVRRLGSAEVRLPGHPAGHSAGHTGHQAGHAGHSRSPSPSPSPSPRRLRREYGLYRHHDYRLETYGSSGSGSRGPSPSNYA